LITADENTDVKHSAQLVALFSACNPNPFQTEESFELIPTHEIFKQKHIFSENCNLRKKNVKITPNKLGWIVAVGAAGVTAKKKVI
jgi:hypothetical protein